MRAPTPPHIRRSARLARSVAAIGAVALIAGCALWRDATLPEVASPRATSSPAVLELDPDRDFGEAWATVLTPDGREEVAQCESVPCRAVVPPGRYHVVVGSGRLAGWIDAYHSEVDVELTACVTDRILVALPARIGPGRGRIQRRERVWLAADRGRIGRVPAGCASSPTTAPPPVAAADTSR
jgi:hypothetical protein